MIFFFLFLCSVFFSFLSLFFRFSSCFAFFSFPASFSSFVFSSSPFSSHLPHSLLRLTYYFRNGSGLILTSVTSRLHTHMRRVGAPKFLALFYSFHFRDSDVRLAFFSFSSLSSRSPHSFSYSLLALPSSSSLPIFLLLFSLPFPFLLIYHIRSHG